MKNLVTLITKNLGGPRRAWQSLEEVSSGQTRRGSWMWASTDIGEAVGRPGRTVDALRTLIIASSAKYHRRTILHIVE
ncbi:MAG: hypothetical protein MZV70_76255 [Desulfobacterales bacterium]|nr:hypothetical protein [Desulfobacterales bacterium]